MSDFKYDLSIEQAMDHIKFKLGGAGKRMTKKDVAAYNKLVEYIKANDTVAVDQNTLFAKLYIQKFMMLSLDGKHSAQSAINEIEDILKMPVLEMIRTFKGNVPFFKFEKIVSRGVPDDLDPLKDWEKIRKIRMHNVKQYEKELLECFRTEYTEAQAIDFLSREINRMLILYSELP